MTDKPVELKLIHNPQPSTTFEEAYGLINDPNVRYADINTEASKEVWEGMHNVDFANVEARVVANYLGITGTPSRADKPRIVTVVGAEFYRTGKGQMIVDMLEKVLGKGHVNVVYCDQVKRRQFSSDAFIVDECHRYPPRFNKHDMMRVGSILDDNAYTVQSSPDKQKGPKGPRGKWGKLK